MLQNLFSKLPDSGAVSGLIGGAPGAMMNNMAASGTAADGSANVGGYLGSGLGIPLGALLGGVGGYHIAKNLKGKGSLAKKATALIKKGKAKDAGKLAKMTGKLATKVKAAPGLAALGGGLAGAVLLSKLLGHSGAAAQNTQEQQAMQGLSQLQQYNAGTSYGSSYGSNSGYQKGY